MRNAPVIPSSSSLSLPPVFGAAESSFGTGRDAGERLDWNIDACGPIRNTHRGEPHRYARGIVYPTTIKFVC